MPPAGHIGIANPWHHRAKIFDILHILAGQIRVEHIGFVKLMMDIDIDGGDFDLAVSGATWRLVRSWLNH